MIFIETQHRIILNTYFGLELRNMVNIYKSIQVIIIYFTFNIFLMQSVLIEFFPYFNYSDEIFVFVIFIFGFNINNKEQYLFLKYYMLFIVFGCLSSLFSDVDRSGLFILLDMFSLSKPVLLVIGLLGIKMDVLYVVKKYILYTYIVMIPLCFIFALINPVFKLFPVFDIRYGIPSFQFIFNNPGEYGNVIICLIAIFYSGVYKYRKSIITILIFSALFSTRAKTLVVITIFIFVIAFFKYKNVLKTNEIKFKKRYILISLIICFVFGGPQLFNYFGKEVTPRSLMLITSISISNEYFPFGGGYSSFGSSMAKEHYSPLYEKYNFDNIYGLNKVDSKYLNDNFWPMIIGQFGYIGCIIYVLFFYTFFKVIKIRCSNNIINLNIYVLLTISLVISTIGAALFTGVIGLLHLLTLFIAISRNE